MSKKKRDLFDVLGISTYEHSYTKLLATLFKERQEWARDFFREVFGHRPAEGTVRVKTQLSVPHEGSGKTKDRLDLVLTFGDAAPDIWIIEAKIKSGESSDQLRRYASHEAQQAIADRLGLKKPLQVKWHYSYLTLEGEEPSQVGEFVPAKYEPLCKIFPRITPKLDRETLPAYECLRNRFYDYYEARGKVLKGFAPSDSATLEDYMNDPRGLIDETSRFYWLVRRIVADVEVELLANKVGKTEQGNPFCQIRAKCWQGKFYEEGNTGLSKCFDVHFELKYVRNKSVEFMTHYETNPYMRGLNTKDEIPEEQRKEYWERRKSFAEALSQHKEELRVSKWELKPVPHSWENPPPGSLNQLAKFEGKGFHLDRTRTVGDFREWVLEGVEAMVQPLEHAGKEVGLWQ